MNRKKIITTTLITLALTLSMAAVAYGFSWGCSSSITTGIITMTGKSTVTTYNGTASEIIVNSTLYRDDVCVGQKSADKNNVTSLSASATGSNEPGLHYNKRGC